MEESFSLCQAEPDFCWSLKLNNHTVGPTCYQSEQWNSFQLSNSALYCSFWWFPNRVKLPSFQKCCFCMKRFADSLKPQQPLNSSTSQFQTESELSIRVSPDADYAFVNFSSWVDENYAISWGFLGWSRICL